MSIFGFLIISIFVIVDILVEITYIKKMKEIKENLDDIYNKLEELKDEITKKQQVGGRNIL